MKTEFNLSTISNPATRPIGWLESISILKLLHKHLRSYGLITICFGDFYKHFVSDSITTTGDIPFFGEAIQLAYLFDLLISYKCVPFHDTRRHKVISEHFCNSKAMKYKPRNLSVALNQVREHSPGIMEINEIFEKLFKAGLKKENHQK